MDSLMAIILVNYNGYNDTVECVHSILESTFTNYKIILVENASGDAEKVKKDTFLQSNTDIVFSDNNLGFSGGNNLGIAFAKQKYDPDYYLLLNNDTVIEKNTLEELIKVKVAYPDFGIVTGKILYYAKPDTIWAAGGKFSFKTGIADQPALGKENKNEVEVLEKTTFVTGCVMLIRKEVIEKVGLLEESYFLYAEDTDYCCRVMKAGYDLYYTSAAIIYHKVSASTGKVSSLQQYYNLRNNFYIISKYCESPLYGYARRFYRILKRRKSEGYSLRIVLRAWRDFRRGITGRVEGL